MPKDKELIEIARGTYAEPGQIEIDDNAEVSRGAENGAFVQAWVWGEFPEGG